MSDHPIYIVGSGGHCRSVVTLLRQSGFNPLGVFDDSFESGREEVILGVPLVGTLDDIAPGQRLVLAIGDNVKRSMAYDRFRTQVLEENVIHPDARIEEHVTLGKSNLIFAGAYLNGGVSVRSNCILNTACVIEHESAIGYHCHISVSATLCGRVAVGDYTFVGAGATIIDRVSIAARTTIGVQAGVVHSIEQPSCTWVGVPARKLDT